MIRRTALIVAVLLLIVLCGRFSLPLQAQEDEESLVVWLAEQVDEMLGRVERLERLWAGPGAAGSKAFLQNETALNYWGLNQKMPQDVFLITVKQDSYTGETLLVYVSDGMWAEERWFGCEFRGSSGWHKAAG